MSNPYYSDSAPKRGAGKHPHEAIGTTQHGPRNVGKQEPHGGAKDGPSEKSIPTNAENSKRSMCGFGGTKTRKGIDGAAVKEHTGT